MQILKTVAEVKKYVTSQKMAGKTIGFVPTMGALHEGHLSLGRAAGKKCDVVIYSIFVNPTQFGPTEDLDKYPRTFEADSTKLESIGASAIFYPTEREMYPDGYKTFVKVKDLGTILCGKSRTNHFEGVTTVVLKLFNIVQCDHAFFGLKDFQQFTVLRTMVKDLNLPVELHGVSIVREADGLAMSSRNAYLNPDERKSAVILSKTLFAIKEKIASYQSITEIVSAAQNLIQKESLANIEYIEVRRAEDLSDSVVLTDSLVMLLAVRFGKTRLIDNLIIK